MTPPALLSSQFTRNGLYRHLLRSHSSTYPWTPPLPSSVGPGKIRALGSPAAPVWLSAPCSRYGLGGVAPGAVGA